MKYIDEQKSLQELENDDWGEPTFDSYVVRTAHQARRIPLHELTNEHLRLLIGQKISLEYLVPIALRRLKENPFLAGDYYEGDVLENVLKIPQDFWQRHPELHFELDGIVLDIQSFFEYLIPSLNEYQPPYQDESRPHFEVKWKKNSGGAGDIR